MERCELKPNHINYEQETEKTHTRKELIGSDKRDWLKKFTKQELSKCSLFQEVFGKSFVDKKLITFGAWYLEDKDALNLGYQEYNNVTLCIKDNDKDKGFDYFEEIKRNDKYKQTLLHEMVHFLLSRNDIDTGIKGFVVRKFGKNNWKHVEIGRGLNEGLTEWITEKCGHSTEFSGYSNLTNIIKELEIALGPKAIMKLGKGKNINRILKMKKQECYSFLEKGDAIYNLILEGNTLNLILNRVKAEEEINEPEIKNTIKNLINSPEYHFFLQGNENTKENFIKFCQQQVDISNKQYKEVLADIDNTILKKYFKKDVAKSAEKLELSDKMLKLYNLMIENNNSIDQYSMEERDRLLDIPNKIRIKQERNINKKYAAGELKCSDIIAVYDSIQKLGKKQIRRFIDFIDYDKDPEIKAMSRFIMLMENREDVKEFSQASITQLAPINQDIKLEEEYTLYNIDGTDISDHLVQRSKEVTKENADAEKIFSEYTLKLEEDDKKILREFDDIIVHGILDKNDNAKVKILNRVILVEIDGEKSYYIIDNGIIPAKVENKIDLSREQKKDKKRNIRSFSKLFKKRNKALPESTTIRKQPIDASAEWRKRQVVNNITSTNVKKYPKSDRQEGKEENNFEDPEEPDVG